jgi:hypothetical protein
LFPFLERTRLEMGRNGAADSPNAAPDSGQIGEAKPASRWVARSFPQAFAFVLKVDASNVKKIQDVVVSC